MHIHLGDVEQCQGYLKSQDNLSTSSLTTGLLKDLVGAGWGRISTFNVLINTLKLTIQKVTGIFKIRK